MNICHYCGYELTESTIHNHGPGFCMPTGIPTNPNIKNKISEAARAPVDYRYDLLDSDFLHCIAQIGAYGAQKYGDFNYQKNRLTSDKSPMNHVQMHIHQYKLGILHDHFKTRKHQLAAAAFNLMMEFFYLEHPEKYGEKDDPIQNK